MKYCSHPLCLQKGVLQSLDNFSPDKRVKDGTGSRCKKCESEQKKKKWAKLTKEERKAINLRNRFNMSLDEYRILLDKQNGLCKICKTTEYGGKPGVESFYIDHCHKTGKIRGLLCNNCNTGLGKFKDNVDFLKEAIEYLNRGKE